MSTLGNILWLIFCGFWQGLSWLLVGLLWCVSIIGIPVGIQCFKLSRLYFLPFGKKVVHGGGAGSCLLNMFWLFFGGIPLAVGSFLNGILLCITIIGIPFGKQCFKLASLALTPFGASIEYA